jgi:ABC-type dipeptide/oligopeptide/nickel transport system permease component
MRTGLLEVIRSDYVRTARAKGLPESLVVGKHALRNGLMPILTLLAGLLPAVLGGSVIIEYIFGIPGMGLWLIDSIYQRDYNVIMAVQLLSTILVLWGLLLTDLSYALVDPRIRYS